jgi:hypothetical protein
MQARNACANGFENKPRPAFRPTIMHMTPSPDQRLLIKEALRVVRKGGPFGFQDLFLWKRVYGEADDLLQTIRSWGIDKVELVDTSRSPFITRALKLPFMVGTIPILHGRK